MWVVLLIGRAGWEICFSNQKWEVTRHQYGISAHVSQTSFRGKPVVCVLKRRLFSGAKFATKARIPWETHKH